MSNNPLRRIADSLFLAGMRPPLTAQLLQPRHDVDLTGKRILVTGASSGIGEATARAVAARGAVVLLVARREDELERLLAPTEHGSKE